ncbi:mucoidy inhibitor MuiA family protein [Siphonobacter sp. SORGH_AS_0500]|uniref:DUF4139 domain-containing protein n=1 Tax=Siphonobacter sp. SORGH_AS_0500 TaxID=1864824 RepID=UPI0028600F9A|nr:mucoidy inhibitor MuiA family protein [Siphonobacter sp. SORGH_AS_0500]MDR6196938.1 hypothetical protein [Siphonobacter sp. SORGH_AS_0500]
MRYLFLLLLLPFISHAEIEPKGLDSRLEKVTVFLNGAQISRKAQTAILAGKSVFYFRNLSPKLDKESIQLKAEGDFTVLSVQTEKSYYELGASRLAKNREYEKKKDEIEAKQQVDQKLLDVYRHEEELLLKNQTLGGKEQSLKASEVKEAADFQRQRLTEVYTKQLEIDRRIKAYAEEIKELNRQQTIQLANADQQVTEVWVTINAARPVATTPLTLSYFVSDAGWIPSYDLRANDLSKPLKLGYKAQVFQFSGEDWDQVKLSLSTADPRRKNVQPELRPWYAGRTNTYKEFEKEALALYNPSVRQVSGKVSDEEGNGIAGATVMLVGTSLGTITDVNGMYRLSIPPKLSQENRQISYSIIGTVTAYRPIENEITNVSLVSDTKALQEVVVVGYGNARREEGSMALALRGKGMAVPLEVQEKQAPTSFTYQIEMPYSILSDGKSYAVEIKEEEVPARYIYTAVPKLSSDVMLTAEIADWSNYQLQEGEINLFLEGTFVGKTQLTLPQSSDTLKLNLGRDASVQVSRKAVKEFSKTSFWGNNRIQDFAYVINLRNARKQSINLMVYDQFPLSNVKNIEILNKKASQAEVNEETGLIIWNVQIAAGKAEALRFEYRIQSPKETLLAER